MASDSLGDRMKDQYENRTRVMLPRRTYTIIRIDGKAFHTFTRDCEKPNDLALAASLDQAALALCQAAQGVEFAYLQSDEMSFLLTDFAKPRTQAWFDGNLQKICSVAASTVTAVFNTLYRHPETRVPLAQVAMFDARVFVIPDPVEVENYFIWRQQDATRNSIQSLAQAHFSHKRLHGLDTSQLQELLFRERSINWNDLSEYWKRGRCLTYDERDASAESSGWRMDSKIPVFTQDRDYLVSRVPRQWATKE